MQEDSVEVFVKETQEDKDGEESENESGDDDDDDHNDDDNDESESEEDINDGSGIWSCQDCENLPKTLRKIKKSFNTMQKEFKSLKTRFEDIKVQSSSNHSETVTPTFAKNKAVDNTSGIEEKRKLIEQNIVLTRENLELKDRLNINYNGKTIESSPAVLSELETDCNDEDSECDSTSSQYKHVYETSQEKDSNKSHKKVHNMGINTK